MDSLHHDHHARFFPALFSLWHLVLSYRALRSERQEVLQQS